MHVGHVTADELVAEYAPAPHANVVLIAEFGQVEPAGHDRHAPDVVDEVAGLYDPALHGVGPLDPIAHQFPSGHGVHWSTRFSPVVDPYDPAGQRVPTSAVDRAGQYEPTPHTAVGVVDAVRQYDPAVQGRQSPTTMLVVAIEYDPAGHASPVEPPSGQ